MVAVNKPVTAMPTVMHTRLDKATKPHKTLAAHTFSYFFAPSLGSYLGV
jgi:hypothetical protein